MQPRPLPLSSFGSPELPDSLNFATLYSGSRLMPPNTVTRQVATWFCGGSVLPGVQILFPPRQESHVGEERVDFHK